MDVAFNDSLSSGDNFLLSQDILGYLIPCLYFLYFIIGTASNIITIGVLLYYRQLRRMPFNVLVVYRAILDLTTCCVSVPAIYGSLLLYTLNGNSQSEASVRLCLLSVFMINFCMLSSVAVMIEMAVLRVICVSRRLSAESLLTKTVLVVIISSNSVVMGLYTIYRTISGHNVCNLIARANSPELFIWTNTGVALSYAAIICGMYAWIAYYTRVNANRLAVARHNRYDIATYRSCILIVFLHVSCYLPFVSYCIRVHRVCIR